MHIALRDLLGPELLGVSAARAVAVLLSSFDDIEEIYLAELRPLPLLQDRRELNAAEQLVFQRAREHRERTGLSFWDAVLLELAAVPDAIHLLDEAFMHVTLKGNERALSWESATTLAGLERACDRFTSTTGASLVFLSEVRCRNGSRRHLPMVDFHAASSEANERLVVSIAEKLFPEGSVLMGSGKSYHAYGTHLLSEEELRCFLGRALLFAPIIDRAYTAHQVIEGRCALRLTVGGGKDQIPKVIAVLQGV